MKEEKSTFTVRSYTKSELAHLYNPQLTLKNATRLRDVRQPFAGAEVDT